MSLIQNIKARRIEDFFTEGSLVTLTGTVSAGSTDEVILSVPDNRFVIVTAYQFSTDNGSAELMSFGLRGGTPPSTLDLFTGFVGGGQTFDHNFGFADWRFGDLGYDVVVTNTGASSVAYTVDLRISSSPEPLGYIERIGTKNHANPFFGLESGADRGQSEF